MSMLGLKKVVKGQVANKLIEQFCSAHDSEQYSEIILKNSMLKALQNAQVKDEEFVNIILKKLIKKYPQYNFPQRLTKSDDFSSDNVASTQK